ncbi:MAG: dicarboxylate/amino acid:cation symporter [Dorea sp.]|nr:dicarboxylate/amino acid:cation symporter [Dorea sp.]MCI9615593.1 dicarboxylate/amino acid:cation symporter [Dorea sp.]
MKKKISLSTQVMIAVILAVASGLLLGEKMTVLAPVGNIFLSLIKTLVIPLVFCSICGAVCNMQDIHRLKSVGGKVLALFVVTTGVAAAIGIAVSEIMNIGVGLDYSAELTEDVGEVPGVLEVILNMFPSNIVNSMAEGNNLQVIIFAVLLGCAIIVTGRDAESFKKGINSLTAVLYSLTGIVMKFSPVGIFCLLGNAIGEHGAEVFSAIGSYILAVYISCFIVLVFDVILAKVFGNVGVKEFLKAAWPVALTAFTTRSSAGTLPVTIEKTLDELKVSEEIAGFTLPLGATINMNGAALNMTAFGILAANACGVSLSLPQYAVAIFICTISGIGVPGVPSGGLVLNLLLLSTLGLPAGLLGLITGIDNLTDMICTATNVVGDMVSSVIVDHSEKKKIKGDTENAEF